MRDLLSNNDTKEALINYLSKKFVKSKLFGNQTLIIAWKETCYCNDTGYVKELASTQEEADTKIILHCIYASKKHCSKGSVSLNIFSPDTDVLILLIKYYESMIPDTLCIIGSGVHKRKLDINVLWKNLTELQREALPALHAISGCDSTGGFSNKGKQAASLIGS